MDLLARNLFGNNKSETRGELLYYKLFEVLVILFTVLYLWRWAEYIPKLGVVLLPLGIANYVDVSFMFEGTWSYFNASLATISLLFGFFKINRFSYLIALLLFHLQYVARFSQGEISHGSNMVGMALLALAVAHIVFENYSNQRKFAVGATIFFFGLGYTSAAICKLIGTGPDWIAGSHLWLWMAERATDRLSQHGAFSYNFLQEMILENRWMATLTLLFGITTEFFGFLFWFKKTRPIAATLLIGMHIGILLTMNISFSKYMYLLLLLGYPWYQLFDKLLSLKPDSILNQRLNKLRETSY